MSNVFSNLKNQQVVSLQTGPTGYRLAACLADPADLRVALWVLADSPFANRKYLLPKDIREFGPQLVVINDESDIVEQDEIVRLRSVLEDNCKLVGCKVVTTSGTRLGTVKDFGLNRENQQITKLMVKPTWLTMLFAKSLTISHKQIVKVDCKTIVVKENTAKSKKASPELLPASS